MPIILRYSTKILLWYILQVRLLDWKCSLSSLSFVVFNFLLLILLFIFFWCVCVYDWVGVHGLSCILLLFNFRYVLGAQQNDSTAALPGTAFTHWTIYVRYESCAKIVLIFFLCFQTKSIYNKGFDLAKWTSVLKVTDKLLNMLMRLWYLLRSA